MLKAPIKKILLFSSLFVLLVCVLFFRFILTSSMELGIKYFSEKVLDADFISENVSFNKGKWVFDNATFAGKKSIKEGGVQAKVEKLTIMIQPHLFDREVDIEIHISKPHLDIRRSPAEFYRKLVESLPARGLVAFKSKVVVEHGVVSIHDTERQPSIAQTLFFQLNGECSSNIKGSLIVSLDDPNLEKNCIALSLAQMEKRHFALDLNFDGVDCASLVGAATPFFPPLQTVAIEEGFLKGKMELTLPKTGAPFARGDMTIQNLALNAPAFEMQGQFKEVRIHLQENEDPRSKPTDEKVKPSVSRTVGHLELAEDANILFQKDGIHFCNIQHLIGALYFQTETGARLAFEGQCEHHGKLSPLHVEGQAVVNNKKDTSLDLKITLDSEEKENASIHFVTRQLETHFKYAEITFANIGPSEFDMITTLATPHFPEIRQINMNEGRIDASALAYMKGLLITDFKIEKMKAKNLQFDIIPWDWTARMDELSGDLMVNLDANKVFETLNGNLVIAGGQLCFDKNNYDLCQLNDVNTRLKIARGVVLESAVEGTFAGLKGTIHLDGLSPDGEMAKLKFHGNPRGLISLSPPHLRPQLEQRFNEDLLTVSASISKLTDGAKIVGLMEINAPLEKEAQKIHFGFELEKASQKLWGAELHQLVSSYWEGIVMEGTLAYLPIVLPISLLEGKWLHKEMGLPGIIFRNGWFQAQDISLDKYIAPLMFPEADVKMTGVGDLQGNFDRMTLKVGYNVKNLSFESSDFCITATHELPQQKNEFLGTQFFDLISGTSHGTFPMRSGTYLEKKTGSFFEDIAALITFSGNKFQLDDLETRCKGITFKGKLNFDLSPPGKGNFDVDIQAHTIQSSFSQLQDFFSPFPKLSFFQKFPLEGTLALRDEGMNVRMSFRSEKLDMQTKIAGTFNQGTLLFRNVDVVTKDLSFNFDYNQFAESFEIKDINGQVFVGKGDQVENYALAGDKFSFHHLSRKEAEFDLWIGDQKRDIIRIAGQTSSKEEPLSQNHMNVTFDRDVSHFGDVHPSVLELSLKDWTQVEQLNLAFEVSLETILRDLQIVAKSGLFCLPSITDKEFDDLKNASGRFAVNISYDAKVDALTYHAIGQEVKIDNYKFNKCSLHGGKKDCRWSIDQLILDDLAVAADVSMMPEGWKFDFLGLRYGESFLAGLEGEYRHGGQGIDAKVNLLECNLSKLHEWPFLQTFISEYHPKGFLRANGQLRLELPSASKKWRLDALVSGNVRSLELKGIPLQDASNVSFHFNSNSGLTIRQLQTAFKDPFTEEVLGLLSFEKVEHNHSQEELIFDRIHFNVPAENLKRTAQLLQHSFPHAIEDSVASIICNLKQNGNVEGSLALHKNPSSTLSQITLKEGSYHFLKKEHEVNNFTLNYDLKELKILTQYRFQNHLFWLQIKSRGPSYHAGNLLLSDGHPDLQQNSGASPLRVEWRNDPWLGLQVLKAEGSLAGMDIHLVNDHSISWSGESIYLIGDVAFHPQKTTALISTELCERMKMLRIGDQVTLKGQWRLDKFTKEQGESPLYFQGDLLGNNISIKGYQFQRLLAQVDCIPKSIEVRQFRIEDPAGILSIDRISLYKTPDGIWQLDIPRLNIVNFRPSLLQEVGSTGMVSPKPLLVKRLDIEGLKGSCRDVNTLRGSGKLFFVNPPKKHLQNTILAIPAEILTMIGLDLTVLNPISGTIMYDIYDGKIMLTKFKNVYSEGKLSKFNLSHSSPASYLDFDGNLHVHIRMKQHNLFFKLAELFTVSIGGNLIKPSYSLQRLHQNKSSDQKKVASSQ